MKEQEADFFFLSRSQICLSSHYRWMEKKQRFSLSLSPQGISPSQQVSIKENESDANKKKTNPLPFSTTGKGGGISYWTPSTAAAGTTTTSTTASVDTPPTNRLSASPLWVLYGGLRPRRLYPLVAIVVDGVQLSTIKGVQLSLSRLY